MSVLTERKLNRLTHLPTASKHDKYISPLPIDFGVAMSGPSVFPGCKDSVFPNGRFLETTMC